MTSTAIPSRPSKQRPGLLDLPPEVRHQIYRILFCHKPSPITLGSQNYFVDWLPSSPDKDDKQEPTFYTALFRVNKAISRDALQFAYAANSFGFDKDIETFCRLGPVALSAIRNLRVYKNAWLRSSYADAFWATVNRSCSGLEMLIIEAASHVLLGAIPYLKDFMFSVPSNHSKPRLVLDLTVLDRHFSFDFPDREYQSTLQDLHDNMKDAKDKASRPQCVYVMRLPRHVKEIRLVLDIGPGAYRAMNEILEEATDFRAIKVDDVPSVALDSMKGRGKRVCFVWQEVGG